MFALVIATVAVLALLLWLAGNRAGPWLLGSAWAAIAASLVVAGVAVGYLEPNFGPYAPKLGVLLAAIGVTLGAAGVFFARRLGAWLGDPARGRGTFLLWRLSLGLGFGLTLAASLHARGRPTFVAVPIGTVTLIGAKVDQGTAYRSVPRLPAGAVISSTLADLTGPPLRRACFSEVLGLLAVCLVVAPILVAIVAIRADSEARRRVG